MSTKEKAAAPAPPPAATATPAPGAEPAAAEAPKVRKERKKAKPKANVQVWKLYKISDNSVERLRRECPRCGHGYFMAEHKDRQSCGHCGYTSFKNK
jgi:small subunit ribosomal protein S27Ae